MKVELKKAYAGKLKGDILDVNNFIAAKLIGEKIAKIPSATKQKKTEK